MIDNSLFHSKKVFYHTLGCKLNFAETSAIGRQLSDAGFLKVRSGEEADICVINTCSVTDVADHKCRQAIKRIHRQHPSALIVVTGCYAQLKPEEVSQIEGVDIVLGSNEKFDIVSFLQEERKEEEKIHSTDILKQKEFKPACSRDGRTRFFLKVQDGCDYYCTYCTIPYARGHSRSGTIEETVQEAKEAINQGAKEIVLTGVNTGDFGRNNSERFIDLVRTLDKLHEEVRFRISSIEPNLLTDELIQFIAQSNHFMPHFHIPLQSGSDEVLKLMKRRYDANLFRSKIQTIRQHLPDAFIGIDVIVGVRGETDELFQQSKTFLESLEFSQLHVFTYSERAGTKMLDIDNIIPVAERKKRSEILREISEKKLHTFYQKQIGKESSVLWESRKMGDYMTGFTENYVRAEQLFNKEDINSIKKVRTGEWNEEMSALKAL